MSAFFMGLMEGAEPVVWRPSATTDYSSNTHSQPGNGRTPHAVTNEVTANDNDYMSIGSNSNSYGEVRLTGDSPGYAGAATLRFRARYSNFGPASIVPKLGDVTKTSVALTSSFVTYTVTFSQTEAQSLNLADLRLRFTRASSSPDVRISWIELVFNP